LDLIDNVIKIAYDINKDYGCTIGNDIKIHKKENKERIQKITEKTFNEIQNIEFSNDNLKTVLEKNLSESQKSEIKNILLEDIKGTRLEFPKFAEWKLTEFYNMTVQLDYAITGWTMDRICPVLAEGTRVSCCFPKFSLNPKAYGYNDRGYTNDVRPFSQFVDCMVMRYNLYAKQAFTAKQGYLSKRLGVSFGYVFTDYNGQVIGGFKILSPQYGMSGLNPRIQILQPLPDIQLPDDEFKNKYKDKKIQELRRKIMIDTKKYCRLTMFIKNPIIDYKFVAGMNYEQVLN
jgi:hypothetical protein